MQKSDAFWNTGIIKIVSRYLILIIWVTSEPKVEKFCPKTNKSEQNSSKN